MNVYRSIVLLFFLININLLFAQETVTFRTDRDTYVAGENVWINACCLKSGTSLPSTISKIIYVEVLDSENVPVKQLKLYIVNGSCATQFELPETLPTGNYLLRGYTKWMRNYNPELYFTKEIAVINPFSANSFPKSDNVYSSDTLIFYPEGGKILLNRPNKITVHSFDKFGNSKSVSGEIISPAGTVIQNIETASTGFITFTFTPKESGVYKFRIEGSSPETIEIPAVMESGINLQLVEESKTHIYFKLSAENYNPENSLDGTIHIVTSSGDFVKSYPVLLNDNEKVVVETDSLQTGYFVAFLIDKAGEILASRYFVHTAKASNLLTIKFDKARYSLRSPVLIEIENRGKLKNVSVSVVKQCLINEKSRIGRIARPGNIAYQSFVQLAKNRTSINDLLLCFVPFKNVLANAPKISFLPEIKGEIISGTILNADTHKPVANKVFILSFVSKIATISFSKTDSLGRFNFVANRFGQQEIVIQPFRSNTSELNYKVNLDSEFSPEYSDRKIQPLFVSKENIAEINKTIISMQVNALYSPFNSFPVIEKEHPVPVCFYGTPEISVLIDKFIELPTIEEIIAEIVPFTHITRKKGQVHIKIYENESLDVKHNDSFCMVDGVPIENQNNILKMNYKKVEKIDVVNLNYFIETFSLGNILNIITRNGDMSSFDFDKRLFRQEHSGYSPEYLFNCPDYSVDSIRNSRIPDFRNLLYWNPAVKFDGNGKSEISFYTSDEATKYMVVVEGINNNGIFERRQIPIEVREE